MKVREVTSKADWQSFVDSIQSHTFLNSWNWAEFEKSMGRPAWRLGVFDDEGPVAVGILSKTIARRGTFLLCHHGPLISPEKMENARKILNDFKNFCVELAKKENCDFLRVAPILSDTEENKGFFKELGFRNAPIHVHSELSWVLDLTKPEEQLLKEMKKSTRYALRKAEKDGVQIETSEDIKDIEKFWTIYMATAERQKFTPYSREYIENEFRIFMADKQGMLFFAKYNGEIVSTAFIVFTANSGFYHHGASVHSFSGVSGSELIQWHVIQEAKRRGCTEYNFWGVVAEDDTKHPWYGLSRFKRGFGGREEPHVHTQDIALRPKYWLNWIIEYTRKIKRGV